MKKLLTLLTVVMGGVGIAAEGNPNRTRPCKNHNGIEPSTRDCPKCQEAIDAEGTSYRANCCGERHGGNVSQNLCVACRGSLTPEKLPRGQFLIPLQDEAGRERAKGQARLTDPQLRCEVHGGTGFSSKVCPDCCAFENGS